MKKKILALILSAVMLVTYMPVGIFASADAGDSSVSTEYNLADGKTGIMFFGFAGNTDNYNPDGSYETNDNGKNMPTISKEEHLAEIEAVLSAGYVNTIELAPTSEYFAEAVALCTKYECKFWMRSNKWNDTSSGSSLGGFIADFYTEQVKAIKAVDGAWDLFLGFLFDEPFLGGMTNEAFKEMTRQLYVRYNKRINVALSSTIVTDELRACYGKAEQVSPTTDALKYVTDIGFNDYSFDVREGYDQTLQLNKISAAIGETIASGQDYYRYVHKKVIEKFDHPVNFWFYPCAYKTNTYAGGTTNEEYCIAHVNFFKELLEETTNTYANQRSGGIAIYTYDVAEPEDPDETKREGLVNYLPTEIDGTPLYTVSTPWYDYAETLKGIKADYASSSTEVYTGIKYVTGYDDGATYAVMVPETLGRRNVSYNLLQYNSLAKQLYVRNENDENFYIIDGSIASGRANTNIWFYATDMPVVGSSLDPEAIAIRIKINDNNPEYYNVASEFQLYINEKSNDINAVLDINNDNTPLWLDLNDASLTKMYAENGYSIVTRATSGFETVGDMDGYIIVPFAYFSDTVAAKLKSGLNNIQIKLNSTSATSAVKASSWENKEFLFGDTFFIEDIDKFVTARTQGITKYSSGHDDGAYIAHRIPGYKSSYGLNKTMYASKTYSKQKGDPATAIDPSTPDDGVVHISTIAGGDRAIEVTANTATEVTFPAKNIDTYDGYNTNAKFSDALCGVPTEITSKGITGLAIRVAVTGNDGETSTFAPAITYGADSIADCYFKVNVAGNQIPFIDYKTGKITYYTTTSSGIAVEGNIDGYLVIPDLSKTYWSGLASDSISSFRGVGAVLAANEWNDGSKFYLGESYWLTDVEKFTKYHSAVALKLYGASLTLESDLTINFKADKAEFDAAGLADPYATFRFGTNVTSVKGVPGTTTVNKATGETKDVYIFSFKGIAPNKLGDKVTATLSATRDGKKMVANTAFEYSVSDYCSNKFNEHYSAGTQPELMALVTDLLNYGAAAQKYTNYKTNALVNKDVPQKYATSALPTMTTDSKDGSCIVNENATANWSAVSLYLKEKVSMKFKFTTDLAVKNLKVAVTSEKPDAEQTLSENATIINAIMYEGNNKYCVEYSGLDADDLRVPVYVTIYDAEGNAVSNTLMYSVEAYAASKADTSNVNSTPLSKLVVEMMKYGDSAEAYAAQ